MDFDEKLKIIAERAYASLTANQWWDVVAKRTTGLSKKERVAWIMETASLDTLADGQMRFRDMAVHQYEYEHEFAGNGLKLNVAEFEDKDENGIDVAGAWAEQIGAQMAYWPQKQVAAQMIANPIAYDTKAFFATDHPTDPTGFSSSTTYSNLLSTFPLNDVASGGVTEAVALDNLTKALAFIRSEVRTPDGKAPRRLQPTHILHPPTMAGRIQQITGAQFINQSGGSGDVSMITRGMGLATPVEAAELALSFGGSDKDCYIICKDIVGGELGGFIYSVRKDFEIIFHDAQTSAEFARTDELQWTTRGRNTVAPGHPFAIFKILGS